MSALSTLTFPAYGRRVTMVIEGYKGEPWYAGSLHHPTSGERRWYVWHAGATKVVWVTDCAPGPRHDQLCAERAEKLAEALNRIYGVRP